MRRYQSTLVIVAAVVLILFFGLLGALPLSVRWLLIIGVFVGMVALVGREVTGNDVEVRLRSGRTETRFQPGRFDAVLIDSRNKISLSRLQLLLWTIVVLSAWATLALHRVIPVLQGRVMMANAQLVDDVAGLLAGDDEPGETENRRAAAMLEQLTGAALPAEDATPARYAPLDIAFPQEVLLALGISTASLAGAGLIKTNRAANPTGRTLEIADAQAANVNRRAAAGNAAVESLKGDVEALEGLSSGELEDLSATPPTQEELDRANEELRKTAAELRAAQEEATRANQRADELAVARAEAVGELHVNSSYADARWSDMMRGDTIANFQLTDLGKVQMFFFTIVLVFAYASLIWSVMTMPLAPQVLQIVPSLSLPAFSDSVVLALALSHGGYLATKTVA